MYIPRDSSDVGVFPSAAPAPQRCRCFPGARVVHLAVLSPAIPVTRLLAAGGADPAGADRLCVTRLDVLVSACDMADTAVVVLGALIELNSPSGPDTSSLSLWVVCQEKFTTLANVLKWNILSNVAHGVGFSTMNEERNQETIKSEPE